MEKRTKRKLILEDGSVFEGYAFGGEGDRVMEVVFNTSPVGYEEIVSDPSYTDQGVVMIYPLIGNYGVNTMDAESDAPSLSALIVGEYNPYPSNFRSERSLGSWLDGCGIPGLYGVDTRMLARKIRMEGSMRAFLSGAETTVPEALEKIRTTARPQDAVARVSTGKIYTVCGDFPRFRVAAVDCGIKKNILRSLTARGCAVTVYPFDAPAERILSDAPDGLFLSNGPGAPTDVGPVIGLVRALRGKMPMFGICLGHQMIALAYGAQTYKLKFGHRGGNHPVRNLQTGRVEITSQNHSYAVREESLAGTGLTVTHRNLLDGTVEGLSAPKDSVFSVQYHPESAPGPEDSGYLFDRFIEQMGKCGGKKDAKAH